MSAALSEPAVQPEVRPWTFFHVRPRYVTRLSPHLVRVGLAAAPGADPALDAFADNGFDQRIKLVMPPDGGDLSELPTGDGWWTALRQLPEERRAQVRTYTVRRLRQRDGEPIVEVDMVLHTDADGRPCGPASRWLASILGDEPAGGPAAGGAGSGWELPVALLGPDARHPGPHGGLEFVPGCRDDLLLAADETALPAVAVILEQLAADHPDVTGTALIEVPHPDDTMELVAPQGISVQWLPRTGVGGYGKELVDAALQWRPARASSSVADTAEPADWDDELHWDTPQLNGAADPNAPSSTLAFVAGEAGAVKTIRRHLVGPCGLPRDRVAFMGYWKLGRAETS